MSSGQQYRHDKRCRVKERYDRFSLFAVLSFLVVRCRSRQRPRQLATLLLFEDTRLFYIVSVLYPDLERVLVEHVGVGQTRCSLRRSMVLDYEICGEWRSHVFPCGRIFRRGGGSTPSWTKGTMYLKQDATQERCGRHRRGPETTSQKFYTYRIHQISLRKAV